MEFTKTIFAKKSFKKTSQFLGGKKKGPRPCPYGAQWKQVSYNQLNHLCKVSRSCLEERPLRPLYHLFLAYFLDIQYVPDNFLLDTSSFNFLRVFSTYGDGDVICIQLMHQEILYRHAWFIWGLIFISISLVLLQSTVKLEQEIQLNPPSHSATSPVQLTFRIVLWGTSAADFHVTIFDVFKALVVRLTNLGILNSKSHSQAMKSIFTISPSWDLGLNNQNTSFFAFHRQKHLLFISHTSNERLRISMSSTPGCTSNKHDNPIDASLQIRVRELSDQHISGTIRTVTTWPPFQLYF